MATHIAHAGMVVAAVLWFSALVFDPPWTSDPDARRIAWVVAVMGSLGCLGATYAVFAKGF